MFEQPGPEHYFTISNTRFMLTVQHGLTVPVQRQTILLICYFISVIHVVDFAPTGHVM